MILCLRRVRLGLLLLACLLIPARAGAQEDKPLWEELQRRLKSEAFSFGAVFQFLADYQGERSFPGENGFSIPNFRLQVSGRLDGGVDYLLRSNFGDVLDARIGFRLGSGLTLDAGKFKTPYSREFLAPISDLDFVNRSQSIVALAPGRALGVGARGALGSGFGYQVGVFNGGRREGGNDRGRFQTVGRLAWRTADEAGASTEVAVNVAHNGDRIAPTAGTAPSFQTLTSLIGIDTRIERGPWLFSGELDLGQGAAGQPVDPWGGYLTIGRMLGTGSQLLIRLDHLDTGLAEGDRTLLILGWNYWPTSPIQLQVNGLLPLNGFDGEPRLLSKLQLAF